MKHTSKRQRLALASAAACLVAASNASADIVDASALTEAVTLEGVRAHQQAFQDIADANGGNRAAGTTGYLQSLNYVSEALVQAGYLVDLQLFGFITFDTNTPSVLEQTQPVSTAFLVDEAEGFATPTYSGSGDVTAPVEGVDLQLPPGPEGNSSTSGCEAEDFADFTAGNIALVQRGNCTFFLKAQNAQNAGAVGVVIFNEGQEGRTDAASVTLGEPDEITIPVVFSSFAVGEALAADGAEARLAVDAETRRQVSANIIADAPLGNPDQTVVVGAHLDSVAEGPGINDNGSGSAAILETALQIAELGFFDPDTTPLQNRLRFAWWGVEELGLVGSEYYVANLMDSELAQIMVNLNFDMIGSPNYARFVYDGDGSDSEVEGPEGSAFVEWMFRDYFDTRGLANTPTEFSGRSDYGPFIERGVPAGGLFTGAEGIKTDAEEGLYGGEAGVAYDPCYHDACDTFENNSDQGLDEMSDAVAYSVMTLGRNDLPIPQAQSRAKVAASRATFDYWGSHLVR